MPIKRLGYSKNYYEKILFTYVQRRSMLYIKYILNDKNFDYKEKSKNLSRKIKTCISAIRKYQHRQNSLETTNYYMKEFLGVDMKRIGSHVGKNEQKLIAKNIFYKYLLDNGMNARYIAEYCGIKQQDNITRTRRNFQKSFQTNEYNRQYYHKFISFIKEQKLNTHPYTKKPR